MLTQNNKLLNPTIEREFEYEAVSLDSYKLLLSYRYLEYLKEHTFSLFNKDRFISFGYSRFLLPFVVSKEVVGVVKKAYPELTTKKVLKLFYLAFNTKRCRNNKNPIISCDQISMAVRGKPWSRDFNTEKYLKLLQKIMGGPDYFEWSNWSYKESLARTVVRFVLKPEVELALKELRRQIRKHGYEGLELIDVRTGRKWKPTNKKNSDKLDNAEQILNYLLPGKCPDAIEFLHNYNECEAVRRTITRVLKKAYAERQEYIFNIINNEIKAGASRERMVQCFTACLANQNAPYYQASKNGKTVRIHPKGESFLGLTKTIRQILCIGCWDLDLTNAHPVIYATIRKVKGLLELIESGKVVYKEIFKQLKKSYPQLDYLTIKRYLKAGFNALLNGAKRTGHSINHVIFPEISNLYPEIDPVKLRNKFFKVAIVAEVYKDAQQWVAEIKRNNYSVKDAYSNEITDRQRPHSLLSAVLQSWEMKLVKPVYEYAGRNNNKVTVVAHQHDGVTVKVIDKRRGQAIINQITREVETRAKEQGFTIKLEAEQLIEEKLINEKTRERVNQEVEQDELQDKIQATENIKDLVNQDKSIKDKAKQIKTIKSKESEKENTSKLTRNKTIKTNQLNIETNTALNEREAIENRTSIENQPEQETQQDLESKPRRDFQTGLVTHQNLDNQTDLENQSKYKDSSSQPLLVMIQGGKAQNYNNHEPLTPVEIKSIFSQEAKPLNLDIMLDSDRTESEMAIKPSNLNNLIALPSCSKLSSEEEAVECTTEPETVPEAPKLTQDEILWEYKKLALKLADSVRKHYPEQWLMCNIYEGLKFALSLKLDETEVLFNKVIKTYPLAWQDWREKIQAVGRTS